ncbi:hypothetical protein SprV_0702372200 [Sparganum proliferum]
MFRIPGRTPTPPHQPTTSRPTPELGGHCAKVSRSSPNAGRRRRGPQRVVPTAEDEILAVLRRPGCEIHGDPTVVDRVALTEDVKWIRCERKTTDCGRCLLMLRRSATQ